MIDWGDVCRGDPAIDLMTYWFALPAFARPDFLRAYGVRARGPVAARPRLGVSRGAGLLAYALDVGDERLAREALRLAASARLAS